MNKYNEGILFQNHHLQLFPFGGKFKTSEKIECSWQIVYYNLLVSNNKNKKSERSEKAFIE
jgi:hypothetical protein